MEKQKLVDILLELRSASIRLGTDPSENEYKNLIHKYDIIFCGKKLNIINSVELCHSLRTKFNIEISLEELNQILPEICSSLNMTYEPLIALEDAGKLNPPIATYSINLF